MTFDAERVGRSGDSLRGLLGYLGLENAIRWQMRILSVIWGMVEIATAVACRCVGCQGSGIHSQYGCLCFCRYYD